MYRSERLNLSERYIPASVLIRIEPTVSNFLAEIVGQSLLFIISLNTFVNRSDRLLDPSPLSRLSSAIHTYSGFLTIRFHEQNIHVP